MNLLTFKCHNVSKLKIKIKVKCLLKRFSIFNKLNEFLLNKKILNDFLKCSNIENQQLQFYSEFVEKGDIVFDVGANVGTRTKIFLNLGANVISYEPQPELFNHLFGYLKSCRRCKILQLGLSNEIGEMTLHTSSAHVLSSMSTRWINATKQSGRFKDYNWNNSITVQVSTLDKEIKENGTPSFIKIDVEGYELTVLEGLSSPIKHLSFEFSAEEIAMAIECIDKVILLGSYKFNYIDGENHHFNHDWMSPTKLISCLKDEIKDRPLFWGDIFAKIF